MLYVNVYLVSRSFGGRDEGGWWFDVGTPLASIPVDSDYKPGKDYYLSEGIHIHDCRSCAGTGTVDDNERCPECGLIPDNPEEVWKAMQKWQEFFKDEAGRYEEIRVTLEADFAQPFPDEKPLYE